MWRKLGAALAVAGPLFGVAPPVRAQQIAAGSVPIAVYPEQPGLRFELQTPDGRRPVALCEGACTAYLPPGRYRLFVHPTEETRAGARTVKIEGPSAVQLQARSKNSYQTGLTLGVVGSALILASTVMLLSSIDDRPSPDDDTLALSLVGFLTGAVLTPIGWVSFGRSLRPAASVQRIDF